MDVPLLPRDAPDSWCSCAGQRGVLGPQSGEYLSPRGFEDFVDAHIPRKVPVHLVLVLLFLVFWSALGSGVRIRVTAEGGHCQGRKDRASPRG